MNSDPSNTRNSCNLYQTPKAGGHGMDSLHTQIQVLKADHPFPTGWLNLYTKEQVSNHEWLGL